MSMRFNLARTTQKKGVANLLFHELIREFAEEYDFNHLGTAISYVATGKQGLAAFVRFMNVRGYTA